MQFSFLHSGIDTMSTQPVRQTRQSAGPIGKHVPLLLLALLALGLSAAMDSPAAEDPLGGGMLAWSELPALPDPFGFAGPFVGVSNGALIVAGGANFPDEARWETAKVWHDRVFVLPSPDARWQIAAERLPRPLGYGISLTLTEEVASALPTGVLCIGGCDADRHYAEVFLVGWRGEHLQRTELPPLPRPTAYACGGLLDNVVYVAGGLERPDSPRPLHQFLRLRLDADRESMQWESLPPWPGAARMLSVAGVQEGCFYLISGTDLVPGTEGSPTRRYLTDSYRYRPEAGGTGQWERISDLPHATVAAPTPAATCNDQILVLGGDDGRLYEETDQLRDRHPGFPARILGYDVSADRWSVVGNVPKRLGPAPVERPNEGVWPAVTTATVSWRGQAVVASGEIRPRVRTPRVMWATCRDESQGQ